MGRDLVEMSFFLAKSNAETNAFCCFMIIITNKVQMPPFHISFTQPASRAKCPMQHLALRQLLDVKPLRLAFCAGSISLYHFVSLYRQSVRIADIGLMQGKVGYTPKKFTPHFNNKTGKLRLGGLATITFSFSIVPVFLVCNSLFSVGCRRVHTCL
jgi:hypothetical protein